MQKPRQGHSAQGDAREAERVVGEVEREEGHEPHESNEAPALRLDAGDQAIEPAARLSSDPIRCDGSAQ